MYAMLRVEFDTLEVCSSFCSALTPNRDMCICLFHVNVNRSICYANDLWSMAGGVRGRRHCLRAKTIGRGEPRSASWTGEELVVFATQSPHTQYLNYFHVLWPWLGDVSIECHSACLESNKCFGMRGFVRLVTCPPADKLHEALDRIKSFGSLHWDAQNAVGSVSCLPWH